MPAAASSEQLFGEASQKRKGAGGIPLGRTPTSNHPSDERALAEYPQKRKDWRGALCFWLAVFAGALCDTQFYQGDSALDRAFDR